MRPYESLSGMHGPEVVKRAEATISSGRTAAFFDPETDDDGERWNISENNQRSQNYHDHAWNMLEPLLVAHSKFGREDFLKAALVVAVDWSKRFATKRSRKQVVGEYNMAWYDMAVGLRALRLSYIIEAAQTAELYSKKQKKLLLQTLEQHRDYLADDRNICFHNNHGFYQAAGQFVMGRRFENESEKMSRARLQGEKRLARMLSDQFAPDGIHKEHSPDYHRMVYRTARSMAEAGLIQTPEALAFLDTIERSLAWFIQPDGYIANIGDSDNRRYRSTPETARTKWQTQEMIHAVTGGEAGSAPASNHIVFHEGGYAVARIPDADDPTFETDSYLVQQAAFHSRTHKHADTLSFLWSDRGSRILIDAGRYGYVGKTKRGSQDHEKGFWYSDHFRMYCESTRAHNCLEFDDLDYPRKDMHPFGSATGRSATLDAHGIVAFESEAEHFPGLRHVRLLVLCGGKWLICFDWFEDVKARKHDAVQWFHFDPAVKVESDQQSGLVAPVPTSETPLHVVPLLGEMSRGDIIRGQKKPRIQGWWSHDYRKVEPNDAIGFQLPRKAAGKLATIFSFSGTLEVDRSGSLVSDDGREGSFKWQADGCRHTLTFKRPVGGDMSLGYVREEV